MPNMLDYLKWRGDVPLSVAPFCPVDNLILSWFAMMPLDGLDDSEIREADELLDRNYEFMYPLDPEFVKALLESERFGSMRFTKFENQFSESKEMQFSAVTVLTGDGNAFVAFRGTDSSFIGWKEDFNMALGEPVPAQIESVRYLEETAKAIGLPLRVGGHSKGGNLAVYASANCSPETQAQIIEIYNNDGPGMMESVLLSEGYHNVEERINTFLPQSSLVGMLLYHTEDYQVIRSSAMGGAFQHDPYTWQVEPRDFVREGALRKGAQYIDRALAKWISDMSIEERKTMIEALYDILTASEHKTIKGLLSERRKSGLAIITATAELAPDTRRVLRRIVGKLITAGIQSMRNESENQSMTKPEAKSLNLAP